MSSSYKHQKLIAVDLVLILIQSVRRGAGDDVAGAVERSAMAGAAEFIGSPVPSHRAPQMWTRGLVADDLGPETRDHDGGRSVLCVDAALDLILHQHCGDLSLRKIT